MAKYTALLLCLAFLIPAQTVTNLFTTDLDLEKGRVLFLAQCAGCHGPAGAGGKGANLARPALTRAKDDLSLFKVIRDGVPGTEMPGAFAMVDREVWQVSAWVRTLGRAAQEKVPGNANRGRAIFMGKGGCIKCHTVDGQGGTIGPVLTDIGVRRNVSHLRNTVLDPASTTPDDFFYAWLTTTTGRKAEGIRLNEDDYSIQIRNLSGEILSFSKRSLSELKRSQTTTPMPSYKASLSPSEVDDLIAYLGSLRGSL